MADPLAITPHASAAVSASGNGTAVDLEDTLHTCLDLTLDVTVVSGTTPTLDVYVDTSIDGSTGWRELGKFQQAKAVSSFPLIVDGSRQYMRVRWVVSSGASFTLTVSGQAHVLYATLKDLRQSIHYRAITNVAVEDQVRQCLRATTDTETALNSAFTLPITAWGADVRGVTADRAMYYSIVSRGFDPESPVDQLILLQGGILTINERPTAAETQLMNWASGKRIPAGMVDQTPTVQESAGFVVSDAPR